MSSSFGYTKNKGDPEKAATTEDKTEETQAIYDHKRDKGKEIRYRVAAIAVTTCMGTIQVYILREETKNPNTSHDEPGKQEKSDQSLKETSSTITISSIITVISFRALIQGEELLIDIDECLYNTEYSKDNQPNRDFMLPWAIVKINGTWKKDNLRIDISSIAL